MRPCGCPMGAVRGCFVRWGATSLRWSTPTTMATRWPQSCVPPLQALRPSRCCASSLPTTKAARHLSMPKAWRRSDTTCNPERSFCCALTSMSVHAGADRAWMPFARRSSALSREGERTRLMTSLTTEPNLSDPDDFYEALIDAHRDLSADQSHALNARLVLLLANHIGSLDVLREALQAARASQAAP